MTLTNYMNQFKIDFFGGNAAVVSYNTMSVRAESKEQMSLDEFVGLCVYTILAADGRAKVYTDAFPIIEFLGQYLGTFEKSSDFVSEAEEDAFYAVHREPVSSEDLIDLGTMKSEDWEEELSYIFREFNKGAEQNYVLLNSQERAYLEDFVSEQLNLRIKENPTNLGKDTLPEYMIEGKLLAGLVEKLR